MHNHPHRLHSKQQSARASLTQLNFRRTSSSFAGSIPCIDNTVLEKLQAENDVEVCSSLSTRAATIGLSQHHDSTHHSSTSASKFMDGPLQEAMDELKQQAEATSNTALHNIVDHLKQVCILTLSANENRHNRLAAF